MTRIVVALGRRANARLRRRIRECEDAGLRTRYLIVLNLDQGRAPSDIAAALGVSASTVYRVFRRFETEGVAGLGDRRKDNGSSKVDAEFLAALRLVVAGRPADFGHARPTWTQELLCQTLRERLGVSVCPGTMSRALRKLGARRGAPKPVVNCPWPAWKRQQRLRELRRLWDDLPDDEWLFYEDEVDIHLNPKIGRDWMLPGQQKEVVTPGQNRKRYLAGAKNARTGELIWVEGERKDTYLFLQLLWELVQRCPTAKVIHVILDNFSIHDTGEVRSSLTTKHGLKLRLHFLPPYSPDENAIERVWKDLHDNVTRNHHCRTIEELLQQVDQYLTERNQSLAA